MCKTEDEAIIMVKATFTPEMREILSGMKGKIFKTYEGVPIFPDEPAVFYGNFRINLGKESIDFTNLQEITQFPGSVEEVSRFQCERVDINSEFIPLFPGPHLKYMVNEKIKSVAIVVDDVQVDDGEYEIEFDMALVITTTRNVYTFTRDWFYGETVDLNIDPTEARPFGIENALEQWKNIQANVAIDRRIEEL